MQSKQARSSNHQNQVPPTIWHQLPLTSQQQIAHLVAQLIQRARAAAKDQESEHER